MFLILNLIIFLYPLVPNVQAVNVDISRINYGAYFQYKATIRPTVSIWRHTISFKMPDYHFSTEPLITTQKVRDNSHIVNFTSTTCKGEFPKTTLCQKYQHHILIINDITRQGYETLHSLGVAINDILAHTEIPKETKNSKRSLLPFVGQLMSSVFGTVSEKDFEVITNQIKGLAKSQNSQLGVFKKQSADFTSFMQVSNERLDTLAERVHDNALSSIAMIQKATARLEEAADYSNQLYFLALNLHQSFVRIESEYRDLYYALQTLVSGYLPASILTRDILQEALMTVQTTLNYQQHRYSLIHTDPSFYYHKGTFTFMEHHDVLYITLQIPLTSFDSDFLVYEIQSFPLLLPQKQNHIMKLMELPAGIAIDTRGEFCYPLSTSQLQGIGSHHNAQIQRIFTYAKHPSCVLGIFYDRPQGVDKNCKLKIFTNSLESQIFHLSDSQFLLQNVQDYVLNCPANSSKIPACDNCIITVPQNCTINVLKYFIAPNFGQNENDTELKTGHSLNLPIMLKFFDEENLRMIKGDSQFPIPPNISLPDFQFYEHETEKDFLSQSNLGTTYKKP